MGSERQWRVNIMDLHWGSTGAIDMKKYVVFVALAFAFMAGAVFARDGYENRPRVCSMPDGPRFEACNAWISTVKRPDYRLSSCCGEADSFIADDFELDKDGNLYAIISADYPDVAPGYSEDADGNPQQGSPITGLKRGTRILVPPEKRNVLPEDANRSPHGVVFLFPGTTTVLCWFPPPLI